ncbi:MAG: hypothetical protein DMD98_19490 [Candidatus Rokuibacteriota bacterium]|jgi:hypothetical protein|nr:MAG: hypothetical protein DMD98_19490 [Candidatus Rokubacteria bacterium]
MEKKLLAVRRCRGFVHVLLVAFIGVGGAAAVGQALQLGDRAPDVAGQPWINSGPLTMQGLRGRVVLVEFWTHG